MIQVYPNADALMYDAAEIVVQEAHRAISLRGRFSVALAGGNTPQHAYELLAREPFRSRIEWRRVFIFWGDERCVPPDDSRSNYFMAREALLDHIPIPNGNVYRIHGEENPADAARDYEKELVQFFGNAPVQFDLVLLGLGTNGHTASLFPGTPVIHERTRRVAEVHVSEQNMWRVTLTGPVLNAAAHIVFFVSGEEKADVLREVILGLRDPERFPAQLIQPTAGEIRWLVDRAAASRLPKSHSKGQKL